MSDASLEDALERCVDAGGESAFDHRRLGQRGDLDARSREGQPVVEVTADRFEQSRVGADAATEHHEREIECRREREDVKRNAPGRLLDHRHSHGVAGLRGREQLPDVERRLERRLPVCR